MIDYANMQGWEMSVLVAKRLGWTEVSETAGVIYGNHPQKRQRLRLPLFYTDPFAMLDLMKHAAEQGVLLSLAVHADGVFEANEWGMSKNTYDASAPRAVAISFLNATDPSDAPSSATGETRK